MAGGGVRVIVSAILGNGFITGIKFLAWVFSSSPSMLAEAIHSLADTFNQILLLVGIKQSRKRASKYYPRGHGGQTYLWNLISAVGIFFLGFGVTFVHAIEGLMHGNFEPTELSYLSLGVLVVSLVIEAGVLVQAYKEFNLKRGDLSYLEFYHENDDPSLLAVLLEDGVAVLGVLLALLGILLGYYLKSSLFDVIASLVISLLLAFMAVALAFINGKLLVGKSLSAGKQDEIVKYINSLAEIAHIERIETLVIGPNKIRLSLEAELDTHNIIDMNLIQLESKKISQGESAVKALLKNSDRAMRLTGKTINDLELKIQTQFPEIAIIDFEIN